ncbi:MFS transporter [Pediococcus argentinicus]|uniref:Efflux pump antibiotic resistance protein n=1 Tax=Pediococcus argentinicus TaxID=480391 RepID=A0A0R2NJV3_9LACO|nr:MFS transporter [Pediococcus argentinicus]KRO26040.1 Efflux pump antibiotic resistance protein [Pediococcus argentinicus]NKZ21701.1 MFS transporter [Pediococcus argentinicus]GEP18863.1 MFS transporter [Pediococcus argentinicus]
MTALRRWLILVTLGIFFFMVIVDGSIVAIAIPTIAGSLSVPTGSANLIIAIYLVVISALLLPFGQIGDRWDRNQLFIIGTILFVVGSWLSGLGFHLSVVLLGRLIQAIGAGITMANSYALVTDTFEPQQLGRAFGIESIFISLGALAGPGIGGIILTHLSWHYLFWINIPIGIICILIELLVFPRKKVHASFKNYDWIGTLLLIIEATIFYIIGAQILTNFILSLILLVAFLFVGALFIQYEKRATEPLLKVSIFSNHTRRNYLLAAFYTFIVSYFFTLLAPLYLQIGLKFSSAFTGELLMVAPLIALVANPLAGFLVDQLNRTSIMKWGLLFLILSQVGLIISNGNHEPTIFILVSILLSIGTALFGTANNTLIMQSAELQERGLVGSLNSLAREFGMILGTTIASFTYYTSISMQTNKSIQSVLGQTLNVIIHGQRVVYIIGLLLFLLAGVAIYKSKEMIKNDAIKTKRSRRSSI